MSETVHTLTSAHLRNERPIWVRPPCEPLSARNLAVFLDGEFYREHVDASAVLDALQGKVADSWIVFVSMASAEARCPCRAPFPAVIVQEAPHYDVCETNRCAGCDMPEAEYGSAV